VRCWCGSASLSFLIGAPCVLPTLPNGLLLARGGRDSVRVYSAAPGTSGRISFGEPVAGQYYLPVSLDGPDGEVGIGVPAWESVERTAAALAADHGVDEEQAKTLLSLAALVRSSDRFDKLVLSEDGRAGPLGGHAHTALTPAEAVALLGLALRANGDFAITKEGSTTVVTSPRAFYRMQGGGDGAGVCITPRCDTRALPSPGMPQRERACAK
jgi:hypothetical protein